MGKATTCALQIAEAELVLCVAQSDGLAAREVYPAVEKLATRFEQATCVSGLPQKLVSCILVLFRAVHLGYFQGSPEELHSTDIHKLSIPCYAYIVTDALVGYCSIPFIVPCCHRHKASTWSWHHQNQLHPWRWHTLKHRWCKASDSTC